MTRLTWPPRVKDYLPKSLFGRALLIIVLPIALMQIAVTWSFFDAHWETVTKRLSESVAGDVAVAVELYERFPDDRETLREFTMRRMSLSVVLEPDAELPTSVRSSFFRVLDRTLRRALSQKLENDYWFDTTRYPAYVEIQVKVDEGVLRMVAPRDRVFATTGHIFLIWIVFATVLLTTVSLLYIRNQARPIERLAAAADRFGRGQDAPEFKPTGASEVRQAAQALLDMRDRIQRHVEQRTTLLAGVSHDLRTPLTRMKLQVAMMPDGEERQAMRADIADMESIVEEYLDFARGQGGEEPGPVDLGDLVRAAADGVAFDDVAVTVEAEDDLVLTVRESAIKRCLDNLIANAAAHADTVRVAVRRNGAGAEVDIDDDGPGIPDELREEAFRPFSRLDPARTRNHKGVGLGLAIARDIARGHGGDVTLSASPMGGLRASVRLPG